MLSEVHGKAVTSNQMSRIEVLKVIDNKLQNNQYNYTMLDKYPLKDIRFTDIDFDSLSPTQQSYVLNYYDKVGMTQTEFLPGDVATNAQSAVMLERIVQLSDLLSYKNLPTSSYIQIEYSNNNLIAVSEKLTANRSGIWVSKYSCYINGNRINITANNWEKVRFQILESLNPSIRYESLSKDEYSKIVLDINGKPWIEKTSKIAHKTGFWASKYYIYINGKKIINTKNDWLEAMSEIIWVNTKNGFSDLPSSHWATAAVDNLIQWNIIQEKGFYDSMHVFNPNKPVDDVLLGSWISNAKTYIGNQQKFVNRIELIESLDKFTRKLIVVNPTVINKLASLTYYKKFSDISVNYLTDVQHLNLNNYTLHYLQESGVTETQFLPYRFTNRAQAVVILDRILNLFDLDGRYNDGKATVFMDFNETHWAYSSLQNLLRFNIIQKQDFYDNGNYVFQANRFVEPMLLAKWLSNAYVYINNQLELAARPTWSLNIHGGYNFGPTEYNSKKQTAIGIEIERHIKHSSLSLISNYSNNAHITRDDMLRSNQFKLGIRKNLYRVGEKNASIYVGGGTAIITPHNKDYTMLSMYGELGSIITRIPFTIGFNVSVQENPMGMSIDYYNHKHINRDMVVMTSLFFGKSF